MIDEEKERAMKDPSFYIKAPSAEARDAMVWYDIFSSSKNRNNSLLLLIFMAIALNPLRMSFTQPRTSGRQKQPSQQRSDANNSEVSSDIQYKEIYYML